MDERIKIVVTDDHPMFRRGIISLLEEEPDFKIMGEAGNGEELLDLLNRKRAHIVLLDIRMPVMNGRKTLEVLNARFPDLKVIILSMDFDKALLEDYIKKGVSGFIPKGCDIEVLVEAIRKVSFNGNCIELSRYILQDLTRKNNKVFKNVFSLSSREIEVLKLTCGGKSNKQIASSLNITERTVEFHKTNIYNKTNLKSQADIIAYGIKNGLDTF